MVGRKLFGVISDPQAACDRAGHHHRVIQREQRVRRCHTLSRLHLWGEDTKSPSLTPTLGGNWHFVLGRCQERDGRVSAGQALLPAERAAGHLLRVARLIRNQGDKAAYFSLLRNAIARKVVRLGRSVGHMDAKYQALKTKKRMAFFIELALPRGITPAFTQAAANVVPDATCDRKAMLRGLFLGCGSVNAPSARYHLEFVAPSAAWATAIGGMAESAGAKVGVMERGGQHVVYVKEGDGIVRLLSWMGASRAVMEFESVRVVREVSGEVNRRLNFETANIGKTVGSGLRQAAAI